MGPHTNYGLSDSQYAFSSEFITPWNLTLRTGFRAHSDNHYAVDIHTNDKS